MIPIKDLDEGNVSDNKTAVIPRVVEPKRHKAKLLVWTDLSMATVDRLHESTSSDHIKQVLADVFLLDHYRTNPKAAIIMELFYNTLRFVKKENFSSEKTSAFFSIIKSIFQVCIETPFANTRYTTDYFKDLVLCHSVNRPPCSKAIFTPEDVMKISRYTEHTFFRHLDMYKFTFTSKVQLDLSLNYVGEMSPTPPPSEVGAGSIMEEKDAPDRPEIQEKKKSKHKDLKPPKANLQELKEEVMEQLSEEAKICSEMINEHITAVADSLQAHLTHLIKLPSKMDTSQQ